MQASEVRDATKGLGVQRENLVIALPHSDLSRQREQ